MSTRVLVTGATGFVAGYVIGELLEHGYAVRATVRDLNATGKRAHLAEAAERIGGDLEFVAADLDRETGWEAAVSGCEAVFHVASPFPATLPDDENELITTAVEGTLRVLRAAAASGTVRRVVLTSSIAAIAHGHADHDAVRTEADWSVVAKCAPYQKSKTLAERAAWDYVESLPADQRFELVVVNPGMVLGPVRSAATSTSHEPIRRLLAGTDPGSPRVGWAVVDVRDLAVVHRLAREVPAAAGNRYVAAGEHVWMQDMGRVLAAEFGPRGYKVPTRALPNLLVRTIALFDKGVRLTLPMLGVREQLSSEKAHRELGWTMRPVRESILDTAESLVQYGVVGPKGRVDRPVAVNSPSA
ncbi:aldehyde reductase [Nocardia sp. XZ_19_385]|uniref:SDR family oxidoreductase n=1 Tax=Nocardia sp. XZ_19_385 TaxID=2769488 RepID=UPI00188DD960|nr:aldehyde reductase [Nocardia sp. XZ_19_385]